MRYYEVKYTKTGRSIVMGNCDRKENDYNWHGEPTSIVCENKCKYFVSCHNDVVHCSYKTEEIKRCQKNIDDLNYELNLYEKYLKELNE